LNAAALAREVARLLVEREESLAVAETTAGGLVAGHLAGVPGASAWLLGGAVVYSAAAKERWLGLDVALFGADGAVSVTAATLMARAARDALNSTWGVAETGIAGPQTGRRSRKPAGLCYVAVAGPVALTQEIRTGLNDRLANQDEFARAALGLLRQALLASPSTPPVPGSRSTQSPG
jgi:nicotinamide-nucleotide amidase